jgi:hypothetical protein
MIGWAELEALLEQQLPPGTVEWGTQVTGYSESELSVVLTLRETKEGAEGDALVPEENLAEAVQEEGGVAPKGWQGRMNQAPAGPEDAYGAAVSANDVADVVSGSSSKLDQQRRTDSNDSKKGAVPAMSAAAGAAKGGTSESTSNGGDAFKALSALPLEEVDENAVRETEMADGGYEAVAVDATPIPAAVLEATAREEEEAAMDKEGDESGLGGAVRVVKAGLLLGADGAFSACRKVCIGDGDPTFDVSRGLGKGRSSEAGRGWIFGAKGLKSGFVTAHGTKRLTLGSPGQGKGASGSAARDL